MALETIFQNWIFTDFVLPFLLIFFIVFAVLEKTKVFGEDKKQIDALVAFVLGLIFVGFAYPKGIVQNMVLFLSVALVVVFVVLMLWGFSTGKDLEVSKTWVTGIITVVILIAVVLALIWASVIDAGVINFFFNQSWSKTFWTNALFVIVVAGALAVVLKEWIFSGSLFVMQKHI